eukprot:scaffold152899_cov20-Tisochrysis_lutea.AAC.2
MKAGLAPSNAHTTITWQVSTLHNLSVSLLYIKALLLRKFFRPVHTQVHYVGPKLKAHRDIQQCYVLLAPIKVTSYRNKTDLIWQAASCKAT